MDSNSITWDGILDATMKIPGIKVNRTEYLSVVFERYGDVSSIANMRPIDLFDSDIVEKVARTAINRQTFKVTAISTLTGIPGGFFMFGTIPADLAQYYFHMIVLAQKLGYIYGWPDLLDEHGEISENTRIILTVFIGVMMGSQAANKALGELTKRFVANVAKKIPQTALTKTFWYPIIKQIGKWLGIQVTKQGVGKGLSKVVPIIGGFVSGGVTVATFRPMANRLRSVLKTEMEQFSAKGYFVFVEEEPCISADQFEELRIKLCINIAKIDFDFTEDEESFIKEMIEYSGLSEAKKDELVKLMNEKKIIDIDVKSYSLNKAYADALIEGLLAVVNLDDTMQNSEKFYLNTIAKDLGINENELEEMILTSRGV